MMPQKLKTVAWDLEQPVVAVVADAIHEQHEYLIIQQRPEPEMLEPFMASVPTTEVIAGRDSFGTDCWSRLSHNLTSSTYFLAALPADHLFVALAVDPLARNPRLAAESESLEELVLNVAATAEVTFIDDLLGETAATFSFPPLSLAGQLERRPWIHRYIQRLSATGNRASSTAMSAFKAGLYLVNDFFEESHQSSQSIEGLGPEHTGDYWHAILHRREPDYGNAKYWFRHVGRHPIHPELATLEDRRLKSTAGTLAAKLERWKSRLISSSGWDPYAFVDLCSTAENDAELCDWCEQVQYDEMLLLLARSSQDAAASKR